MQMHKPGADWAWGQEGQEGSQCGWSAVSQEKGGGWGHGGETCWRQQVGLEPVWPLHLAISGSG